MKQSPMDRLVVRTGFNTPENGALGARTGSEKGTEEFLIGSRPLGPSVGFRHFGRHRAECLLFYIMGKPDATDGKANLPSSEGERDPIRDPA